MLHNLFKFMIILASTCDDGVSLVVEGTAENVISVSFKDLPASTSVGVPNPGRSVRADREDLRALRVEANLPEGLMTNKRVNLLGSRMIMIFSINTK